MERTPASFDEVLKLNWARLGPVFQSLVAEKGLNKIVLECNPEELNILITHGSSGWTRREKALPHFTPDMVSSLYASLVECHP